MKKTLPVKKKYPTKDEHEDADKAFFKAHDILLTGVGDLENAATTVTEYALKSGDRGALAFFMARFADFVDAGKPPPKPMLNGLRDAFNIFREGKSMDEAFALSYKSKGKPKASLFDREQARTNAALVEQGMKNDDTLEVSLEKAVAFRAVFLRRKTGNNDLSAPGGSTSKIKRDYLKYKKLK